MIPLLQPFQVGAVTLRNRFAMAPMTRNMSPGGVPNEENARYYRRHAEGGVGLIVTEGTYIDHPSAGIRDTVPRFAPDTEEGWATIAAEVHAAGAAIFPQLWHVGALRGAEPILHPEVPSSSPSGLTLRGEQLGDALSVAAIDGIVTAYANGAERAVSLGFDGVELHGAHGYLLDQFLWHKTNRRDDDFGGRHRDRATLPVRVIESIRSVVPQDFPVVLRISQWKVEQYDASIANSPDELAELLGPLVDIGLSMFHVSTRRHWVPAFPEAAGPDARLGLAGWVKRVTGLPVITVGSVGVESQFGANDVRLELGSRQRLDILLEQFARDEFDVVAIGRALVADPDWVKKMVSGHSELVIPFQRGEHNLSGA